ncbi:MAG: hypothetical protein ACOZCO_02330 [Bacteroidota bacterium]
MEDSGKKSGKSRDVFYIIIILLLMAGTGFMYFKMDGYKKDLETCATNTAQMEKDIEGLNELLKSSGKLDEMGADLKANLEILLEEFEGLETSNVGLQDSIARQIHVIDSLKVEAEKNKGNAYVIYKLNKEAETLRRIMVGYVHTIDSLNTANQELRAEIKVKDNKINEVTAENEDVKNKNKDLNAKVEKGSVLQTSNLTAGAIHVRGNGNQVATTRAGRADMIKACCSILENPIAKAGTKGVYMVVMMPDGTVLAPDPNARFKWAGGESQFSLLREIDYQNAQMDLCMYAEVKDIELPKGVYNVELFCEKAKIGKTTFTLK